MLTPDTRAPTGGRPASLGAAGDRPRLHHAMLMVAGLALGLWLMLPDIRGDLGQDIWSMNDLVLIAAVVMLGGLSVVGPVVLIGRGRATPWNCAFDQLSGFF